MKNIIYLDNAATTKTAKEAVDAMLPFFMEQYGNAGSIYSLGTKSKQAMEESRRILAESIKAQSSEIYFTSGGSEADNWALKAAAKAYGSKGKHIIVSKIEHHAILNTCEYLKQNGYEITYVDVDEYGILKLDELKKAIRSDTILISVMFANNEVGTIQPVKEIGEIAKEHDILFHTDAVQAYGHVPIDVKEYFIDMLSTSAHKINGPKGVGFLYIRQGLKLHSLIHGGHQERGWRAGTENIPGIVGYGAAVRKAEASLKERMEKEKSLRDHMIDRLLGEIPDCHLNGHRTKRLPGNVNVSFPSVEGEALLILLDMEGICASSGSACTQGLPDPSHVLLAMGVSRQRAKGSLRLTLSSDNTREEIDYTVDKIKEILKKLKQD
ncbi:MAG: cysteine desulfurase NifS [Lachnospiraceae bacterium]|nr:cysteine desulfurase NifS [Lachnospiraceae bacterium]